MAPTEPTATHRQVIDEDAPSWLIEELTDQRPRAVRHGSNRWVGVAIGVAVAAVGLGFVSHITDPAPTPGSQVAAGATAAAPASGKVTAPSTADDTAVVGHEAPLVISLPVPGATVDGGLVEVRGVAERPLGGVHLSIVLGDAVLGWTNVKIDRTGPFRTVVPIYSPAFEVPAVLRIEGLAPEIEPGRSLSIDVRLRAGLPVGLWRAGLAPSAPDIALINGFAPLPTGRVLVTLRTATGRALEERAAVVGVDAARPGSVGGRLIGLGSFRSQFDLAGLDWHPADGLVVAVSWRDPVLGKTGTIEKSILAGTNLAAVTGVGDDGHPSEGR